jgi:hypothetical protein
MSFALASAYGNAPVGPGQIELRGVLHGVGELGPLVESTVLEGCVGETLAALEASETAAVASEAAARVALARIAEDEARHAELAWAFVRFAVGLEPALAEPVGGWFRDALARAVVVPPEARCFEPELAAFGFLTREALALVRRRAVADVLTPAARAVTAMAEPR